MYNLDMEIVEAIEAMNSGFLKEYYPDPERTGIYSELYKKYTALGAFTEDALY